VIASATPILVTGAAGFAGTHLLDLLADSDPIVGWHHPDSGPPARPHTVRWRPVDLLDQAAVQRAIADARPRQVYHLAGAAHQGKSWDRSDEALRVNALGTHHLLAALGRESVPARVLVVGSAAVYRPSDGALDERSPIGPTSPYGLSKLAQELIALHAGATEDVEVIVSRSFNHIGPGQSPDYFAASFARQIVDIAEGRAEPVLRVGNLTPRRDLTDVRDTVRAYRALMEHGRRGEVYNVCAGRAYAISEILDGFLAESGIQVRIEPDPARLRPVDQPVLLGSCAKVHRETGWAPQIPLAQSLRDLLADWRTPAPVQPAGRE
jgi:GDP-4-dehydro-6-deoxy-D-mannose reductase